MASASFGTSEELVFESPSVPEGEVKMTENKIAYCKIIGSIENVWSKMKFLQQKWFLENRFCLDLKTMAQQQSGVIFATLQFLKLRSSSHNTLLVFFMKQMTSVDIEPYTILQTLYSQCCQLEIES